MPTYEYKCDACGHAFEKFQSITSSPIKKCPKCGKNKVRRLISAGAGLIFKGSGFYITDYRDQGYSSDKAKADLDYFQFQFDELEKASLAADEQELYKKLAEVSKFNPRTHFGG